MAHDSGIDRNVYINPANPTGVEKGLIPTIGADYAPSIHIAVTGSTVQVQPAPPAAVPAQPPTGDSE